MLHLLLNYVMLYRLRSAHFFFSLPWWFLYIAWFLVITVSIVCSYFVMLYGLKYGYNKSVSWLVSFITGFAQSAFIQQPLKVIAVAVIITLIFKKPVEFEDYGPEIDLGMPF